MLDEQKKTETFKLYEAGKNYNIRAFEQFDYYDNIDTNYAFYQGDQWRNVTSDELPKPVINILKRVLGFHIANLNTDDVNVIFEPLENNIANLNDKNVPIEIQASELLTAEVNNILEKYNFNNRLRDISTDMGITGDGAMHMFFDTTKKPFRGNEDVEGEIVLEMIDGSNIMFGNPNVSSVEKQPYILVIGRDLVSNLREEAKSNNSKEYKLITSDKNDDYQAGDQSEQELDAKGYEKALYIIKYQRGKDGKIKISKSTQSADIYIDKDTGLNHYPIAWVNWEKIKNSYHGRGVITGLIPNQIAINKMFAMVIYHQMMGAFPSRIIDGDRIPYLSNEIGADIIVNGLLPNESVSNLVKNLEPTAVSAQITRTIEMLMDFTMNMMGLTDAGAGNINNPENTSAIISVQKASIIPLQNVKANINEFVEDIAMILSDMIGTYYGERPVSIETPDGRTMINFDFNKLKDVWLKQKVEVGNVSPYSEIAQEQLLGNLLQTGAIDLEAFLERIPNTVFPKAEELLQKMKGNTTEDQARQAEFEFIADFMDQLGLPPDVMQQFQEGLTQLQQQKQQ